MNKFMGWMTDSFAPKVNKFAKNAWIAAIQEAIMAAMPMILIGSFATVLSLVNIYVKGFPDFSMIGTFSFGLFSIFLSYLIPNSVMKHKNHVEISKQAGLAGLAFFLILIYPKLNTTTGAITFDSNSFGTGGMIAALIAGLFVAFIMNLFTKFNFIGEDSGLPDFVAIWFNTLLPIIVILLVGWLFTFQLHFNLYEGINSLFSPLINLGQSFWGLTILMFLGFSFLYSFGISSWVLTPVIYAIELPGIAANQAAVAAGQAPTNIFTVEATTLILIGGGGATLALCIMMAFLAKSSRLRMIGKAALVPSVFNINEPLVFGAPIAFNPILMIPFWITGLITPILLWLSMKLHLVPIPSQPFQMWYTPAPIAGWIITKSIAGVIFVLAIFAISWIIYYPFFKVYDKQAVQQDLEWAEDEED
ncbi:MAG: PTS transporter subunit EIIC [Streptococcaceae bacterium]|nr:PTS transporter subunit EIIC [Streptococcaceae bacterium]